MLRRPLWGAGESNAVAIQARRPRWRLRTGFVLFLLAVAAAAPLQSTSAAPSGQASCLGSSATSDGPFAVHGLIGYPGDEECFEVYLESGYIYTFKVDPLTDPVDAEFSTASSPLIDSILTVYQYPIPRGYRGTFPPFTFIGYNDDVSPYDRSSRLTYDAVTPPEYEHSEWFLYRVIVGGYGSNTGAFELSITRSVVVAPQQCWMVYGC